jgi:tartrate dehydratase beta subunit/fumarate hydratase class I family protein
MIKLLFPFTEEKILVLKVGNEVLISGVVFTGRDAGKSLKTFRLRSR